MMKTKALALTVALCASVVPIQAAKRSSRPPRLPRPHATPKAPILLQPGDIVNIGGVLYTVAAGLIPVTVTPPPPPPPPPVPTLTGYSPNPVAGGQPVTLLGTNFTDGATATWNGIPLGLILTSPATFSTTAPGVTSAVTAPVILTSSGTRLVGPNLTVTPAIGPAPDMTVWGFRNGNRDYSNIFSPGQTIFIEGKGFGAPAGTVAINHRQVPVEAWNDAEIRVTCPSLDTGAKSGPATLDIVRADHGSYNSSVAFTILLPPGRFGNR